MAPSKTGRPKSLAEQLSNLTDSKSRGLDIDPEDAGFVESESNNSADSDNDSEFDDGGRNHYEVVSKGRLRKSAQPSLGAEYLGSRVSRHALEDQDDGYPEGLEFSDNGSDEDNDNSAQEKLELESDVSMSSGIEDNEEDMVDEDVFASEDENEESADDVADVGDSGDNAEALRRLVLQDKKAVASALSKAAQTDIAKGNAIQTQRAAFDGLLNVRMKLQKALIASNSITEKPGKGEEKDARKAVEAAETAANKLWNTLERLKQSMCVARTGEKRKHSEMSTSTSLTKIWTVSQNYEGDAKKVRDQSLNTWAAKTRAVANISQSRRLNDTVQLTLSEVLSGQMVDMQRLVAKTRTARSCAPKQATRKAHQQDADTDEESLPIYDDADFYGPLLQALVAQRSSNTAAIDAMNVSFANQPWQAAREIRTRKVVDTKASKGRRLRYTAHEAVQNVMTPYNLALWTDRQCDELFASLHGKSAEYDISNAASDDESHDMAAEGLRLFAT